VNFLSRHSVLPVSENERLPYWNYISGFDLDIFIVIGISFCISLPNFVETRKFGIGPSATEL